MRKFILMVCLLMATLAVAQTDSDYYVTQTADSTKAAEHVMTKQESREARKREHLARKRQKQMAEDKGHGSHCYCPYQKSTSVWDDIWNEGIVGTGKALYQSTVKPQAIGAVVGAVQGAANESPLPTLAGQTAIALGTSEVHKARRHSRSKRVPEAGRACNCDPCPYHGQRYKPAQGIQ